MLRSLTGLPARTILAVAGAGVMLAGCGGAASSPAHPDEAPASLRAAEPAAPDNGTDDGTVRTSAGVSVADCVVYGVPYGLNLSGSSYQSPTGVEILICRGSIVGTPPAGGQVFYGVNCYLPQTNDYTTNAQLVVNPTGGAVLRCQAR